MSRSVRKTPIFSNAGARSEKSDKKIAHHTERANARMALVTTTNLEELTITTRREAHSNVYDFAKDGKRYSPVRVTQEGRALQVLSAPRWLKSVRQVHQVMGK